MLEKLSEKINWGVIIQGKVILGCNCSSAIILAVIVSWGVGSGQLSWEQLSGADNYLGDNCLGAVVLESVKLWLNSSSFLYQML